MVGRGKWGRGLRCRLKHFHWVGKVMDQVEQLEDCIFRPRVFLTHLRVRQGLKDRGWKWYGGGRALRWRRLGLAVGVSGLGLWSARPVKEEVAVGVKGGWPLVEGLVDIAPGKVKL